MSTLFPGPTPVGFARVAVERAIDRYPDGLTYAIPPELEAATAGDRVVVGLGRGNQPTPGWVIERTAATDLPVERLKPLLAIDPSVPRLPEQLLALARWIGEYYAAPIGVTLAGMVPSAVKRRVGLKRQILVELESAERHTDHSAGAPAAAASTAAAATATAAVEPQPAAHADAGADASTEDPSPPSGTRRITATQRRVLDVLAAIPPDERPTPIEDVMARAGVGTRGPIERLAARGAVQLVRRDAVSARWRGVRTDARAPERLSDEQVAVVRDVGASLEHGFSVHLLHGVTGSGKTEVYIRLIERVLAAGRTALVLVPEIGLTPQTSGRLLGRFPNTTVAILHSGLTAAQRHHQWMVAAGGSAGIVLGARSAVFAPIPDERLGLIVVDEEHDSSFKQDQAPRYHGRDVALRRGQLAGCPVLLGSATPSMESWVNATERGRFSLHRMRRRAPGMRLPVVRVVDFAAERRARPDRGVRLIGPTLEDALRRTLDRGHQAIILLNRRGYASWIACPDQRCGWVMTCTECDVSVVYHVDRSLPTGGFVRCHHCASEQLLPTACPDCGRKVVRFGLGTQRVEEELERTHPQLVAGETLVRVDSDTMRHAGDFHRILDRFADGTIRVLTGTQMIAKGLDFPGVRLVGVVNADTAINLPDFRAAERTFQLVSQVAGRCGRVVEDRDRPGIGPGGAASTSSGPGGPHIPEDPAGLVVVQSFNPEVPAIQCAARHDFEAFAADEVDDRRRAGLPPFTRLTRLVVRDEDPAKAAALARTRTDELRALVAAGPDAGRIEITGPSPCAITRIAGRSRWETLITAPDPAAMQRVLASARNHGVLASDATLAIDVDPTALL